MIETAVSDDVVGAIHSQTPKNGQVHPVAFLSRKFSPHKMNYNIYDKKIIAIVLAFK